MKGVKEIRNRIKAVNSTAKITRAMQLVASSKMKKAQQMATCCRPYMLLLTEIAEELSLLEKQKLHHPFFEQRKIKNKVYLVIGTDKGLCGALNQNIFKFVAKNISTPQPNLKIVTVGKKMTRLLSSAKYDIMAHFNVSDRVEYHEMTPIIEYLKNAYLTREVDIVHVVFAKYVNPLVQTPVCQHVLPMLNFEEELHRLRKDLNIQNNESTRDTRPHALIIEPNIEQVVALMSRTFLSQTVYRIILEAKASEHSARTLAMKGATDNAEALTKELSLEYNKLRQSAITNEIIEISAAIQSL